MKVGKVNVNLSGLPGFVAAYWQYLLMAALLVALASVGWAWSSARQEAAAAKAEIKIEKDIAEKRKLVDEAVAERERVVTETSKLIADQEKLKAKYVKMFQDLEWARKQLEKINGEIIKAGLKGKTTQELADKFREHGIEVEILEVPK